MKRSCRAPHSLQTKQLFTYFRANPLMHGFVQSHGKRLILLLLFYLGKMVEAFGYDIERCVCGHGSMIKQNCIEKQENSWPSIF